jgi:superoxide dismutase, Fe-Mn family
MPGRQETAGRAPARAIERDFGGLAEFRAVFAEAAVGEFGSGWAWLVGGGGGKLGIATMDCAKIDPCFSGPKS